MSGIAGVYLKDNDVNFVNYNGLNKINKNSLPASILLIVLHNLQHRGQLSAKSMSSKGGIHGDMGLAINIFNHQKMKELLGNIVIGKVSSYRHDFSPKVGDTLETKYGRLSCINDGSSVYEKELTNLQGQKNNKTLESKVLEIVSSSKKKSLEEAVIEALGGVEGYYSWIIMSKDKMIGVRQGCKPLCLGKLGENYILASETCALKELGIKEMREILPGELVSICEGETKSVLFDKNAPKGCSFDIIYRSRADSFLFNENVSTFRINTGKQLAKEHPADAEVVVPVPEAGIYAATGYSARSNIPFYFGLIRDYSMGRLFEEPDQLIRSSKIRRKLRVVRDVIEGKRVVLVDEAILTGTTIKILSKMLREEGVKEIHVRIASPPHFENCMYGMHSPKKELLATKFDRGSNFEERKKNIEEGMRKYFNVDSLKFLSLEGLIKSYSEPESKCIGCFKK